jgi:hypothetical protein
MTDEILQKLLDIEDIKRLRIQYSHFLDSNDLDRLIDLFTEDAVCDFARGRWVGRAELRQKWSEVFLEFHGDAVGPYPYLHSMTNHWIEVTGPQTAEGRCYLTDWVTADPDKSPLLLLGIYADEYLKSAGRWRINRCRIDFVWPTRDIGGGAPGRGMALPSKAEASTD